jgi:uncharacterized protein (TIGR02145 family)
MKKIYSLLMSFLLTVGLMAQAPESFNYQAVVRDASGNIIANTQVGMRISIIQGSILDTAVCKEEFTPTTNDFGLVTLAIGSINITDFAAIDWSAGPYFVKVELDPEGGTSYIEMGTSQLLSVPYALHARTVEKMDLILDRLEVIETQIGLNVKDIDGNVYNTVTIGTQTWMKENLRTTHYADGTAIPYYYWYDNDSATYANTYGALYKFDYTGNLCPTGWHVPTDAEWTTLTDYLGGEDVAGGKLKEMGTTHWQSPNEGATNESGFTALPGGYQNEYGSFSGIGSGGYWWSSTGSDLIISLGRSLYYDCSSVDRSSYNVGGGFSVRCLKDY